MAPPINPTKNINNNKILFSTSGNIKANEPANKAPIINCPSAPIFQIFALKQSIKPQPIIINGHAFTKISLILSTLEKGDIKTWYNVSKGSYPRKVKINKPKKIVKIIDTNGPRITQFFETLSLGTNVNIMKLLIFYCY